MTDKTDRELLELAAKAAGIGPIIGFAVEAGELLIGPRNNIRYWNPLRRDGQALRLAVKLNMLCDFSLAGVFVESADGPGPVSEISDYRRAIVRAAAEIGMAMP